MLELLTLLRPLGRWQVLLAICLVDLAFILVQVSNPGFSASSSHHYHQKQLHLERRLQEVLAKQAEVVQSMRQTSGRLRALYQEAVGRAQVLRQLEEGIQDLEEQIERLKGGGTREANTSLV